MKSPLSRLISLTFLVFAIGALFLLLAQVACTDLQKEQAAGVLTTTSTITSSSSAPSTQPFILAGQQAVKIIEQFVPVSTGIFALISGVTGLAAGIVTGAKGGAAVATAKSQTTSQKLKSTLVEVLDDVAAFKTPGVNWSAQAQKDITDLVGIWHPAATVVAPGAGSSTQPIVITGTLPGVA